MKNEKQNCCFCFNIVSKGNTVGTDILDLLKFLIVNVEISALENSTVCDDCLRKITETCEYKSRNSLKMLVQIKKETDSEKRIICQKCEKLCEQGNIFPLLDCITQVDWSDFVNYLFVDHDLQSLESLQICDSCRISVSNIQDFLKLIYVYDQNRMKLDINNCDDIKATGNKNLVDDRVVIKQEFENFILDDKNVMDNKTEILYSDSKNDGDNISYSDFKCKNEEVELKLEYDDANNQSIDRYEKVDGKEMTSNSDSNMTSSNNEGEEQEMNCQECSRLRFDNIQNIKCVSCLNKNHLDYLNSNGKDGSKIHKCDICSYTTARKHHLLRHKLKHGKVEGLEKYKCQHCIYETYFRYVLLRHIKTHNNIRDFKCSSCPKNFIHRRHLDNHLLKVHKSRDSVTSKIHKCGECSYETTIKDHLSKHQLKHVTEVGFEKYKCYHCIYETSFRNRLLNHIKTHNNIRDIKCSLCPKNFVHKKNLDDHLLKVHKSRDNVTNKIHQCDECNYETTIKDHLLRHRLKHGVKVELTKYKCQYCIYETFIKSRLLIHIKTHNTIRDFKCSLCSKSFTVERDLDDHLLKIHKSKNVASKIHACDKCSYITTRKCYLLKHKLKHGITTGLKKYQCQHCNYETYEQSNLKRHVNIHNIRKFKCAYCLKEFNKKRILNNHLLKSHKRVDKVTKSSA